MAALAAELRDAGYSALADYLEAITTERPLLATAARYFFSRKVADDLWLLRNLRFTRTELLANTLRSGFDRLADALDRFTSVIDALLKDLSGVSQEAAAVAHRLSPPTPVTPAPLPPPPAPGFSVYGVHLVATIRIDEYGGRFAPCPVCLMGMQVTKPGSWVALRCDTCGTEFQASDGSKPPPPPPPELPDVKLLARNLRLWKASGEARCWVEGRKGLWTEADFRDLCQRLRASHFWPLDVDDLRKVLTDLSMQTRTNGTGWEMMTFPPPHPVAPPPLVSAEPGPHLRRLSDHRRQPLGTVPAMPEFQRVGAAAGDRLDRAQVYGLHAGVHGRSEGQARAGGPAAAAPAPRAPNAVG